MTYHHTWHTTIRIKRRMLNTTIHTPGWKLFEIPMALLHTRCVMQTKCYYNVVIVTVLKCYASKTLCSKMKTKKHFFAPDQKKIRRSIEKNNLNRNTKAIAQRYSVNKVFLKMSGNLQKKRQCWILFTKAARGLQLH